MTRISILSVLFLSLPAWAQEAEEPDPYAPIAPAPDTSAADRSNLLNPSISAIGTFALAYLGEGSPTPSGHDPARTGFSLQEIELSLQAAVDPYFGAAVFLSISEHGLEVEEATAWTTALPGFQLEIGQLLAEFGRHNNRHLETWDFVDNHLVNAALLGEEGLGGLGVEAAYVIPTGSRDVFLRVLAAGIQAGASHAHEGEEPDGEAEGEVHDDEDAHGDEVDIDAFRVAALARLESSFTLSPAWTINLGFSGYFAPSGEHGGELDVTTVGSDLHLRWRDVDGFSNVRLTAEGIMRMHEEETDSGVYTTAGWRFARRWDTALRYDWLDGGDGSDHQRVSLALWFEPSEFSRIRLQYGALLGASGAEHGEDLVHQGALQFEFSIGPHGSHSL